MQAIRQSTSIPNANRSGRPRRPVSVPTPEEIQAWVEASCRAQGVPVKITDRATIQKVVVLLGHWTDPRD